MKKIFLKFVSLAMIFALTTIMFSCAEDTDCRLKVTVKDALNVNNRVSNVKLHVGKGQGSVVRDGVSDANGEAFFTFKMEAIMDVAATLEIKNAQGILIGYRYGSATVRLEAGRLVEVNVLLKEMQ